MKIVELIYSLSIGGAERLVVDLCNELAKNGTDEIVLLTVCDSRLPENVKLLPCLSKTVRFESLHQPNNISVKSILAVYTFLKKEKPDVIHCHSNIILIYIPLLLLKCKYKHTLHSTPDACLRYKWQKGVNRYLYKNKVQPVTISKECSTIYRRLYGLENDTVITNGRTPLTRTTEAPADMPKNTNGYTFIHIANCTPAKNQERLFRVFGRLQEEGVAFDLFCLGMYYEKYQARFTNNKQIHILGAKSDVAPYLSFSDFFVLTSDYEGMPISLLEAISLGVVPISTPAGGVTDIIRDGANGYLSEGFDNNSLYAKLKQAIHEHGRISRKALIDEFNERYSIKICANRYNKLYR
ncbi:MAG: glycosyltransferase [Paludibacteraceae bacterium]|nr:glycosyltransferase [Paludibacteraceae bacterium]